MNTIYLIRHALPAFPNGEPVCMGTRFDYSLSAEGKAQAEELAEHFLPAINAIYSSPMLRCIETATPLSQKLNLPIIILPELTELDGGIWDGMTRKEIHEKFAAFFDGKQTLTPPDGESDDHGLARMLSAMEQMRSQKGTACACFSHAGIGRVLLAHLTLQNPAMRYHIHQDYACITRICLTEYGVKVGPVSVKAFELLPSIISKTNKM